MDEYEEFIDWRRIAPKKTAKALRYRIKFEEFKDWRRLAPEKIVKALKLYERDEERRAFGKKYLSDKDLKELTLACQKINQKTAIELIDADTLGADKLMDIILDSGEIGISWLAIAPKSIKEWGVNYFKSKLLLVPNPVEEEDVFLSDII